MMTLHKLHAGDGYTYLTRQVAAGDEGRSPGQQLTDYYTASGNPPGRWVGAGTADLAIEGRVREDQMRALFGRGLHPDADQIVSLELARGASQQEATRAAKLGRAFPVYTPLPPRTERVANRIAQFDAEQGRPPGPRARAKMEAQEARRERRAVAGYDLVFTPVKSVSLLWALGSAHTRQAVEDAHHEAVANTLRWLEQETAFARVGDHGEAQIETRGFIAAAFDHRDSRAGDPDLHTHLAVSNKVRAHEDYPDGTPRWLSLDARTLHAAGVAASERYNTRLEDALTRRLNVAFTERADSVRDDKRAIRELAGMPDQLLKHFSKRRAAIEQRYRELLADYRRQHGHEPGRDVQLKLAEQATLETRDDKLPSSSLADKLTGWRSEAATVIGRRELARLETQLATYAARASTSPGVRLEAVAHEVIRVVSAEKSTWTRWNVIAETERQLRPLRFTTPDDREAATLTVVNQVLAPHLAVQLTPDGRTIDLPVSDDHARPVLRSTGENVLVEHGSARFTTQELLDAEQRLLDYAHQPTRHGVAPHRLLELMRSFEGRYDVTLDRGQRALVLGFAADPRRLVVGIGPAGAGKTTAMRAVAEAWRTTGRRVVPIAPSATAAEVLGAELGCRAENLHKFRHAHTSGSEVDLDPWFVLEPGDLVLVDEAGLAGTRNLDWLTHYARERGAVVRLLGDPAQLGSVEAGGALRLLAFEAGAVELTDLHRFSDPHEAAATVGLREGDHTALAYYFTRNRVSSGSTDAMREAAYNAWAADTTRGLISLLITTTSKDAQALNHRARLDRIATGQVAAIGVELHDGTTAGVGDRIATRKNQRQLTNRDGTTFVKNGDTWIVERRHRTGDLTVRDSAGRRVRLPRDYVASYVELGYAATAARAQGSTVDTAHVFVNESTPREALYVSATRAREVTRLYVASEHFLDLEAERPPQPATEAADILAAVLDQSTAELSATEVRQGHASAQPPRPTAPQPPSQRQRQLRSPTTTFTG